MATRVAKESFRPYWDDIARRGARRFVRPERGGWAPGFDVDAFCAWLRIDRAEYETIQRAMRDGGNASLSFELCARALDAAGMEHLVTSLHLVDVRPGPQVARPAPRPRRAPGDYHGTQNGYEYHRCRCGECRVAYARR